jgi:chlorite dismutase
MFHFFSDKLDLWCIVYLMKWFWQKKNKAQKLQKAYELKMQEARNAQRAGDIQKTSQLQEEADALLAQMQAEEAQPGS